MGISHIFPFVVLCVDALAEFILFVIGEEVRKVNILEEACRLSVNRFHTGAYGVQKRYIT